MKKFELTAESITYCGWTLHRIRALVSFGAVQAGELGGYVEKEGNLSHGGNAWVYGDAKICGDAKISSAKHVLVIGPIGSRNDFTTFFRDKDNEITVKCSCFIGKVDRFIEKVQQTHGDSVHALAYRAAVEIAKLQINHSGNSQEEAKGNA